MYLAVTMVLTGVVLWIRTPALIFPPLAFWLTMHTVQIPREERLLKEIFEKDYDDYCRSVRRWL
jgi:protein-S-isoprenylcysteine O-methyltransferase Ste14